MELGFLGDDIHIQLIDGQPQKRPDLFCTVVVVVVVVVIVV